MKTHFGRRLFLFFISSLICTQAMANFSFPSSRWFPEKPLISYVAFPSADTESGLTITGQLRIPKVAQLGPVPAVVVVHSSAGVDSTGEFYIERLNRLGYATLELDMWASRGLLGGATSRPEGVPETVPDAFGALQFLASLPAIQADKIGIIGFSWGGVVSMLSSTNQYTQAWGNGNAFAAHIAHYPVCWTYNLVPGYEFSDLVGAPVMIQSAEMDLYDLPDTCDNMIAAIPEDDQALVTHNQYQYATHAFDRLEPEWTVFDPVACLGTGCEVTFTPNIFHAALAQSRVVSFFAEHLN